MMSLKRSAAFVLGFWCLATGLAARTSQALADGPEIVPAVAEPISEALKLQMTSAGLDALAREVQARYLRDVEAQPIGSIEKLMPNGWTLRTSGLNYSVAFKGIKLRAANDGVHVDFAVNAVGLHADALQVKRPFLLWDLSSTCKEVNVAVAGPTEMALSVTIVPRVEDVDGTRRLSGEVTGVDFAIEPDAYLVKGPVSCSGILGLGGYMRSAVGNVLAGARAQVETIVKEQVASLLPEALANLDRMLHEEYSLDVGYPGVPLSGKLLVVTAPAAVEFADGRLVFTMGSMISAGMSGEFLDRQERERRATDLPASGTRLGVIGLNSKVINDILSAMHPAASKEFEVTPEMIPLLEDYLTATTLASVWPDMNTLALATDRVRLFVSLPGLPTVEPLPDPASQGNHPAMRAVKLAVHVPKARLRVEVSTGEGWHPYASLDLALTTPLVFDIKDDELAVELGSTSVVQIAGQWADGYVPKVDIIEADLAQLMVKSIFDSIYMRGAFLRLLVPMYRFGGGMIGFTNPRADAPFLNIDLVAK